ncbi:CAP Gly-rich domain-containing protein [Pelagophyceae sp. CCMP2097]|nr:CAP Gly-rich domain-containing protein [Pelagophyceae sp. CCMP2097]|mmetsp:Transcript_24251/g.86606  ORF Transcript_24251/g.86606 Transcript_24251/m.86606 type:complete len:214 (+) Transcript_24251:62-703(+)
MASLAAVSTVRLNVRHVGLGLDLQELAFQNDISLGELKKKLYPKTGTEVEHQRLSKAGIQLDDDEASLRSLGLENGDDLVLEDTNEGSVPNTLNDGAAPAPQAKGNAGFASFRKQRQAATPAVAADASTDEAEAALLTVGQRVTTATGKLATVRFVGPIPALPLGFWCGVELDEATGKNDGAVKGERVFQCGENCGAFLRPSAVKIVKADDEL